MAAANGKPEDGSDQPPPSSDSATQLSPDDVTADDEETFSEPDTESLPAVTEARVRAADDEPTAMAAQPRRPSRPTPVTPPPLPEAPRPSRTSVTPPPLPETPGATPAGAARTAELEPDVPSRKPPAAPPGVTPAAAARTAELEPDVPPSRKPPAAPPARGAAPAPRPASLPPRPPVQRPAPFAGPRPGGDGLVRSPMASELSDLLQSPLAATAPKTIIEMCEAELARTPEPVRAARLHCELGRAYEADLGDPESALSHYRQALDLLPDHLPAIRGARRLLLRQRDAAAAELFDAEIRLTAEPAAKAKLYHAKGKALAELGEPRWAVEECYERGVALSPSDPSLLTAVGHCQTAGEDWTELSRTLERAANAAADDPRYRAALIIQRAGLVESRLEQTSLAAELYASALELDPHATGALAGLKRLLFDQARWRQLVDVLERDVARSAAPEIKAAGLLRIGGIHAEQLGNHDQAVAALLRAAELAPQDRLILSELVRLYEIAGDSDALAGILARLVDITPEPTERVDLFFRIAEQIGRKHPDKAIGWYEAALGISPAFVPAIRALEALYVDSQRWASLVAMYLAEAEAAGEDSQRARAHAHAAEILETRLDDKQRAAKHHALALGLSPTLESSFKALSRLCSDLGWHHDLIELYRRAIDRAPDTELTITYLFKIGSIHEEALHDPAAAMSAYRRIMALQPGHLGAIHALQRTARAAGRFEELIIAFDLEAALSGDPARQLALQHSAAQVLEGDLGDVEAAVARLRQILVQDRTHAPALASLGSIYRRLGRYDDLLEVLEHELELTANAPKQAVLLHRMGEVCAQQLGDHSRALDHYRRSVAADRSHLPARRKLANLLREDARWDELAELLKQELDDEADPRRRASLACSLGEIYELRLEQLDAAAAAYRKALAAVPSYWPALEALGRVLMHAGRHRELAEDMLNEATSLEDRHLAVSALLRAGHIFEAYLDNPDRAITTYETIRHAQPDNLAALLALEPLYRQAEAWEKLADVYRALARGLTDIRARIAALEELSDLQAQSPANSSGELRQTLQDILAMDSTNPTALAALERLALKDDDQELLGQVDTRSARAETDPAVVAFHHTRLGASHERTAPLAALAAYRAALEHDPDSLAAIRGLGRMAKATDDARLMVAAAHQEAGWTQDKATAAQLLVHSAVIRLERLGDRTTAIADAARALELCPDSGQAAVLLTAMTLETRDYNRLIDCLTRAAEATEDARRSLTLGRAVAVLYAEAKGDLPAAVAMLERLRRAHDDPAAVLVQLGDLYERNAQYTRAVEVLEQVVKGADGQSDLVAVRLQLARLLGERLGQDDAAFEHLDRILTSDEKHRAALALRLTLQVRSEDVDAVRETAQRLLDASPDPAEQVWALLQLSWVELVAGDRKAAVKALRRAVAIEGPAGRAAAEYKKLKGPEAHWQAYADALVDHLRRVEEGQLPDDDLPATFLELARTRHEKLGRPSEALATLVAGLETCGEHPALELELGEQLARTGRPQEAVEQFQALVAAEPSEAEAWRSLARTQQATGHQSAAAIAIAPVLIIGEPSEVERNLEATHRLRPGWAQPGSFGPKALQAISAYDENHSEPALVALLSVMAEVVARLFPDPQRYSASGHGRINVSSGHPLATAYGRVAKVFGFSRHQLYLSEESPREIVVEHSGVLTISATASVTRRPEAAQIFILARTLTHVARGLWPVVTLKPVTITMLVAAAARLQDKSYAQGKLNEHELAALQSHLLRELPPQSRQSLAVATEQLLGQPPIDIARWKLSALRTAVRAAAVLAADLPACIEILHKDKGGSYTTGAELVRSSKTISDLLSFWASEPAMQLRRQAGMIP